MATNNYYFGKDIDKNIIKNDNLVGSKEAEYIITQNDFLHKKVQELEKQNYDLQKEKEELENENESLESSKTSIKNYANNLAVFNKTSRELINIYHSSILEMNKNFEELIILFKKYLTGFFVTEIVMIYFIYSHFDFYNFIINFLIMFILNFLVGMIIYKITKKFVKINQVSKNENIQRLRKELKEVNKGNSYLNDLIDNL